MKQVILIFAIVSQALGQTYSFSIGLDSTKPVRTHALVGANQEYVAQGQETAFTVYSVDLDAGSATQVKEVTLGANSNLELNCRMLGDWTDNVVLTSKVIVRFNAAPGAPSNEETYTGPAGELYSQPQNAYGTVYMFVGTMEFTSNYKFYRLHSDRITDVKEFSVGAKTRAYGVIHGTTRVLVSILTTDKRKIYDYTNGFVGGTDSVLAEHTKSGGNGERGFVSPDDGRDYYVVVGKDEKVMYTVKASDGTDHLNHNLYTDLGNFAIYLCWVYDTDLVLAFGTGSKMALYDFMDTSKSRTVAPITYEGGATPINQGLIWLEKRAAIVHAPNNHLTYVYKIPVADQPCSDLCGTCHEIHRKQCVTCSTGASPTSPGATTCSCHDGYYQADLSFSRKQCLACSTLCATCSGGPR